MRSAPAVGSSNCPLPAGEYCRENWCGRRDLNPHWPFGHTDFKSVQETDKLLNFKVFLPVLCASVLIDVLIGPFPNHHSCRS